LSDSETQHNNPCCWALPCPSTTRSLPFGYPSTTRPVPFGYPSTSLRASAQGPRSRTAGQALRDRGAEVLGPRSRRVSLPQPNLRVTNYL